MNLCLHLGAWSWAVHSGSHIPGSDWANIDILRAAGVTACKYLLYEGSPNTQFEDIRRLRQERGIEEIVLRLMHSSTLPSPVEHLDRYTARVDYARSLGYKVVAQLSNEPNLELVNWTPTEFDAWMTAALGLARARWPDVELPSAPMAPHSPNTWDWWANTRASTAAADTLGCHVYANTLEQLSGGYSLGWWLGQAPDKDARVLECGCQTGTPADVRRAMLPRIYSQLAAEQRVTGWYPFIMSSEGLEHSEHWYTDEVMTLLRQVAAGQAPTLPDVPGPTPLPPPTQAGQTTFTLTDDNGRRWRWTWEMLP